MRLVVIIFLNFFIISAVLGKAESNRKQHQSIFPKLHTLSKLAITDPISDKPVNINALIALDKKGNKLGFIREINTTTGCNSECLPVIFTLYYDAKLSFIKLLSKEGLTKLDHQPFSNNDYFTLHRLILKNPKMFKRVKHPLDMVDGFTGATKLIYKTSAVKKAAFTTLRVNAYYQQTLLELKKILKNKK